MSTPLVSIEKEEFIHNERKTCVERNYSAGEVRTPGHGREKGNISINTAFIESTQLSKIKTIFSDLNTHNKKILP